MLTLSITAWVTALFVPKVTPSMVPPLISVDEVALAYDST